MISQTTHRFVQFVLAVFLSVCLTGWVSAQISALPPSATDTGMGGANSISGTILGPSGHPLARRVRILLSTMTRGDRIMMTDENGNFAFRGLPSGNYTVIIDKEKEFDPFTSTIDLIQLRGSPGQAYTLNVRLKSKASTDAKPGVINSQFANVPKRALDLYNKGAELAKVGDHKGSIEQLLLATADYPAFMLAFNELGVEYLRLNELEKADAALLAALKIEPEAFAPLMNRGIVLVQMKRFAEAEPILRVAVKKNEQTAVGHYFLGQALANLGRFDEGEKELVSSITLGGDEMKEAHRLLAIIYNVKGDKKRAVAALENYLRLAPKAPDADQLRKVILQLKGVVAPTPAPGVSSNEKPSK